MLELNVDDSVVEHMPEAEWQRLTAALQQLMATATAREDSPEPLVADFSFVDDARIAAVNQQFRDTEGPTDVLAFASRETPMGAVMPHILGDVIVSVETADRQKKSELLQELLLLCTHGLCHLRGFDHATDDEKAEMDAEMQALLAPLSR